MPSFRKTVWLFQLPHVTCVPWHFAGYREGLRLELTKQAWSGSAATNGMDLVSLRTSLELGLLLCELGGLGEGESGKRVP